MVKEILLMLGMENLTNYRTMVSYRKVNHVAGSFPKGETLGWKTVAKAYDEWGTWPYDSFTFDREENRVVFVREISYLGGTK